MLKNSQWCELAFMFCLLYCGTLTIWRLMLWVLEMFFYFSDNFLSFSFLKNMWHSPLWIDILISIYIYIYVDISKYIWLLQGSSEKMCKYLIKIRHRNQCLLFSKQCSECCMCLHQSQWINGRTLPIERHPCYLRSGFMRSICRPDIIWVQRFFSRLLPAIPWSRIFVQS